LPFYGYVVFADFFSVAVRTGKPGFGGISFLLIERNMPGVTTRQMNCSGVWASGTAYVTFEDVKVPKSHVIGKVDKGFKYIMESKYMTLFYVDYSLTHHVFCVCRL
jgi:alkylation response protein AidB-like acyl-CoA dehydrogenase